MPIRYVFRGQVVEVAPRADVLYLRGSSLQAGNEQPFIERWTAVEHVGRLIFDHLDHPTLLRNDDPVQRLVGLQCTCEEPAFDIQMSLSLVLMASREIRNAIQRLGPVRLPRYVSKRDRQLALRAEKRARDLLHQFLTPEERWSLRAHQSFRVRGQDGKTYLVRQGQTVQLLEDGAPVMSYCIHPREPIPPLDVMLAQKFLLENDIDHFLAHANATPVEENLPGAPRRCSR